MSFDWQQFLVLATDLTAAPDEARQRTSVSRAYYSAYHAASSAAKARFTDWRPESSNRHLALWNCWALSEMKQERRIGNKGLRLKDLRRDADYDADAEFTPARVRKCLEDAQEIIAAIGSPRR